jgi:hypothetical protein
MNYSNHDGESEAGALKSMDLPDESHSNWRRVILGELDPGFEFLALRILLARFNVWGRADESPERMRDCVKELRGMFEKSRRIPSACRDLKQIFEENQSP